MNCHYCGEPLYGDDQTESGYCGLVCLERSEEDWTDFDTDSEDNESDEAPPDFERDFDLEDEPWEANYGWDDLEADAR